MTDILASYTQALFVEIFNDVSRHKSTGRLVIFLGAIGKVARISNMPGHTSHYN